MPTIEVLFFGGPLNGQKQHIDSEMITFRAADPANPLQEHEYRTHTVTFKNKRYCVGLVGDLLTIDGLTRAIAQSGLTPYPSGLEA